MAQSLPMSPNGVEKSRKDKIPSEVFEIVNHLLVEKYSPNTKSATIKQDLIVDMLVNKYNFARSDVFDRGMLDFEDAYKEVGWRVEYDKPGYNESYGAFFKFTKV